eukprot:TRINITY_DN17588_c0_g1_i1.p1 TRINITY_DN17588_c0_g1~~TRINITY_DN17588_c0_g1_i1.p1  ORF type:complete len:73 (+),score=4.10 TRINITY_DN17588_c0_g1_i1:122-340(+)
MLRSLRTDCEITDVQHKSLLESFNCSEKQFDSKCVSKQIMRDQNVSYVSRILRHMLFFHVGICVYVRYCADG